MVIDNNEIPLFRSSVKIGSKNRSSRNWGQNYSVRPRDHSLLDSTEERETSFGSRFWEVRKMRVREIGILLYTYKPRVFFVKKKTTTTQILLFIFLRNKKKSCMYYKQEHGDKRNII